MKFWGATEHELTTTVDFVSRTYFDGNLIIKDCSTFGSKKPGISFTLRVKDSKGKGARRSASGRAGVSACVHATDAVIQGLFTLHPKSRFASMGQSYAGMESYQSRRHLVFNRNIGSMLNPLDMCDACDCTEGSSPIVEKRRRTTIHHNIIHQLKTVTQFADPLFIHDYFPPLYGSGLYVEAVCCNRENANGFHDWLLDQGGTLVSHSNQMDRNEMLDVKLPIKITMELPL